MTPRELQNIITQYSKGLPFIERTLMNWRPRICPFHLLIETIPTNAKVLDIGCGTGLMLFLLSHFERISTGVGIEVYQKKIEIAQSLPWKDGRVSFLHTHPNDAWPVTDIDCILMIDVLHHIPVRQQRAFFQRIRQSHANTVIFKDINPRKKFKALMNTFHDIALSRQNPHYLKPEIVASWLQEMGFTDIQISYPEMLWYSHYLIVAKKDNHRNA
jgi:2-polyprenyl-3-methyl-5-hydroxy-6-metoxy-1,4-benzoquinol methylase